MALEALYLEHVSSTHRVYATFFKDVSNADFLHQQLLARNTDFEYAFIDASSVLSRFQILAATYKGLSLLLEGTLKTPNVHSEIVCALSTSTNVRFYLSAIITFPVYLTTNTRCVDLRGLPPLGHHARDQGHHHCQGPLPDRQPAATAKRR